MEVKCCPGCEAAEYTLTNGMGAGFNTIVGKTTFYQPEYRIRLCNSCGLYYKTHVLSDRELADYYKEIDFTKWEYNGLFPTEKKVLERISHLSAGSRVLDYGCSSGRLLSGLTNQFSCYGVEINKCAAEIATSKSIKIISDDDVAEAFFDAIILCDVFEHLLKPTDTLRRLCRSLTENGLLILCTGNADADACRKDMANFWYFRTLEHLSMLSARYLKHLALTLNLEVLACDEASHYDKSLREKGEQKIKSFLYWQFNEHPSSFLTTILRSLPILQKAKSWKQPPSVDYTKDHVIAVLRKIS